MEKKIDYRRSPQDLFKRYSGNPILTRENWKYPINTVFNAGAAYYDNETVLLVRVEDLRGISHLTLARSKNGIDNWVVDPTATLLPEPDKYPEEYMGIEDPRITYLKELEQYAITYTSVSKYGPLVSLTLTPDFRHFEKRGLILFPENKDAALLPRRVKGKWVLIHRPVIFNFPPAHMWISTSPDLIHWGNHKILAESRPAGWWDSNKIGLGPQPIETPEGWLVIYHGVKETVSKLIYRLGLMLLDLDDPSRVIYRSSQWVFGPQELYEQIGDVPFVTFSCGVVAHPETDEIYMYYGAADSAIALATAKISDLLDFLKYEGE